MLGGTRLKSDKEGTMRRRECIGLLGASVTWPFAAMAQQTAHAYRLGAVSSSPRNSPLFVAMFDELRRRGFIMSTWLLTSSAARCAARILRWIGVVMDRALI